MNRLHYVPDKKHTPAFQRQIWLDFHGIWQLSDDTAQIADHPGEILFVEPGQYPPGEIIEKTGYYARYASFTKTAIQVYKTPTGDLTDIYPYVRQHGKGFTGYLGNYRTHQGRAILTPYYRLPTTDGRETGSLLSLEQYKQKLTQQEAWPTYGIVAKIDKPRQPDYYQVIYDEAQWEELVGKIYAKLARQVERQTHRQATRAKRAKAVKIPDMVRQLLVGTTKAEKLPGHPSLLLAAILSYSAREGTRARRRILREFATDWLCRGRYYFDRVREYYTDDQLYALSNLLVDACDYAVVTRALPEDQEVYTLYRPKSDD